MATIKRTKNGFQVRWFDHEGKRRTHTLRTTDRRAAQKFGLRMEDEATKLREGLVDAAELQSAKSVRQPIAEALGEWRAEQEGLNRSEIHIRQTTSMLKKLGTLAGWNHLADINADSTRKALDQIRKHGGKARKGETARASARTIQKYIRAAKGFTRWCVRGGKLQVDPLTNLAAPNPQKDRKHVRRAMTRDEWQALREYLAEEVQPRRGISAEQRAMLYELLILTGYRKEEFRQLRVGSLQESAGRTRLVLDGKHTKNGNAAHQLIPEAVAGRLRTMVDDRKASDPLLPMPEQFGVVRVLREDLKAARARWIKQAKGNARKSRESSDFLAYEDHQGRKLDIHALRHTCGAWLAESGVQPKAIQQHLRHASITTTFDLYGHLMPGMMEDAIDQLAEALS